MRTKKSKPEIADVVSKPTFKKPEPKETKFPMIGHVSESKGDGVGIGLSKGRALRSKLTSMKAEYKALRKITVKAEYTVEKDGKEITRKKLVHAGSDEFLSAGGSIATHNRVVSLAMMIKDSLAEIKADKFISPKIVSVKAIYPTEILDSADREEVSSQRLAVGLVYAGHVQKAEAWNDIENRTSTIQLHKVGGVMYKFENEKSYKAPKGMALVHASLTIKEFIHFYSNEQKEYWFKVWKESGKTHFLSKLNDTRLFTVGQAEFDGFMKTVFVKYALGSGASFGEEANVVALRAYLNYGVATVEAIKGSKSTAVVKRQAKSSNRSVFSLFPETVSKKKLAEAAMLKEEYAKLQANTQAMSMNVHTLRNESVQFVGTFNEDSKDRELLHFCSVTHRCFLPVKPFSLLSEDGTVNVFTGKEEVDEKTIGRAVHLSKSKLFNKAVAIRREEMAEDEPVKITDVKGVVKAATIADVIATAEEELEELTRF